MTGVDGLGHASEGALAHFTETFSLVLPRDYRAFLCAFNGGQPSPNWCYVPALREWVIVDVLFGLGLPKRSLDLSTWMLEYRDDLAPGMLVIGGDPGANLFVLGTTSEYTGVYYWDHTHAFEKSLEDGGNTYLIAPTFQGFLDGLTPPAQGA